MEVRIMKEIYIIPEIEIIILQADDVIRTSELDNFYDEDEI